VCPPDALLILSHCEFLKKIVKGSSLDFSAETALLNDIDAIAQIADWQPGDADYRLKSMARRLKETLSCLDQERRLYSHVRSSTRPKSCRCDFGTVFLGADGRLA
jgi:hypothetical protein